MSSLVSRFLQPFRQQQRPDTLLLVDIGTVFVRAMLVDHEYGDDGDSPILRVLSDIRVPQEQDIFYGGTILEAPSVRRAVLQAVERAQEQAAVRPGALRLSAGGGMLYGRTIRKQYRREETKKKIDEQELRHILQKVEWHAYEELRKQFARETGHHDTDITILTARASRLFVDGYAVESPLDFRGQDIGIDIFHVYAPTVHVEAFRALADMLEFEEWDIVAEHDAMAQLCREHDIEDAILVDIGGSATTIGLLQHGSIMMNETFAFGGQTITRRIAHHLEIDVREAERVKQHYSDGTLSPNAKRKITMVTKEDIALWEQGVMLALSAFARQFSPLPSQWLLYGGGSLFPKFQERLNKRTWGEGLPFVQEPDAVMATDLLTTAFRALPESVVTDSTIAMLGMAHDGYTTSSERIALNRELQRVVRIIQG